MTQVTGTITYPDGSPAQGASVQFVLVGAARAFVSADDETVVGTQPTKTADTLGEYTIDLPANTAMAPGGTRWRRHVSARGIVPFYDDLIVPVSGGPYAEEDILAEPLPALPTLGAVTEVDYSEIVTANSAVAVNTLAIASVPNIVVTVPDLAEVCYLLGAVGVKHSVANANVALAIGPTGLTSGQIALAKGAGWAQCGAIGAVSTIPLRARIPAHSPGDYQLYINGTAGNATVEAQEFAPSSLAAWRVAVAA